MNYPVIQLSKLRIALQYASDNSAQLPIDIDDWVSFRGDGQSVFDVLARASQSSADVFRNRQARGIVHGFDDPGPR